MYVYIIVWAFLVMSTTIIHEAVSHVTILGTGVLPVEKGSVGVQFFVDIENVNNWNSCNVLSWPKMCCLEEPPFKDCCTEGVYGDYIEAVLPKRRETLVYVYPTLYQHDQIGYCDFAIDYHCGLQKRDTRLDVSIPFNTKLNDKTLPEYLKTYKDQTINKCASLDEDVLNDCAPVKCDLKYSGRRPFFDNSSRKCVNAPACGGDVDSELPNVAYVPDSNVCRDLEQPLTLGDVYIISTGLGVVTKPTKRTTNELKVQLKSNCSTISENLLLIKDLMTGRLCPLLKLDTSDYGKCFLCAFLSISITIIGICSILLMVGICCNIVIHLYNKGPKKELKKACKRITETFIQDDIKPCEPVRVSRDLTNNLLKEVIVRDLPIELRDSVIELCDRIDRDISKKKRYRKFDIGSQVDLAAGDSGSDVRTSSAWSTRKKIINNFDFK